MHMDSNLPIYLTPLQPIGTMISIGAVSSVAGAICIGIEFGHTRQGIQDASPADEWREEGEQNAEDSQKKATMAGGFRRWG